MLANGPLGNRPPWNWPLGNRPPWNRPPSNWQPSKRAHRDVRSWAHPLSRTGRLRPVGSDRSARTGPLEQASSNRRLQAEAFLAFFFALGASLAFLGAFFLAGAFFFDSDFVEVVAFSPASDAVSLALAEESLSPDASDPVRFDGPL